MCGQFAVLASLKAIKDYYEFLKDGGFMFDVDEFYELDSDLLIDLPQETVKPMNYLPIITNRVDTVVSVLPARWGLVPHWAKDESFAHKTINARIETLSEKASFKYAYQKRRCLVPMTGFYEKGRYFPNNDERMKSFAGLYEVWERRNSEVGIVTFTVVTCPADERVLDIHHRMPVVLDERQAVGWMNYEL